MVCDARADCAHCRLAPTRTAALAPSARTPWRYLRDTDVLHAGAVALLAVLLSGGLVWLAYLVHTWRMAVRTPTTLSGRWVVLVFGRRLRADRPGPDYRARLARALVLARGGEAARVLLLGGHGGGRLSEAEAGHAWLLRHGLPAGFDVLLEQESVDSLENLRHARVLLCNGEPAGSLPPVALLTSRYHLARCLMLARRLGFQGRPVAAEVALPRTPRYLALLLAEASYLMWIDLGMRWARLIGHRRMAERIG